MFDRVRLLYLASDGIEPSHTGLRVYPAPVNGAVIQPVPCALTVGVRTAEMPTNA